MPFFRVAARAVVGSSPCPTNGPFVTPSSRASSTRGPEPVSLAFPKDARILKPGDFRRIYDNGVRVTCPFFAAFCLLEPSSPRARFGFTVPRAIGKANVRNRIRRRFREALRLLQHSFPSGIAVVFNPRRTILTADLEAIRREITRLATRLNQQPPPAFVPPPDAARKPVKP